MLILHLGTESLDFAVCLRCDECCGRWDVSSMDEVLNNYESRCRAEAPSLFLPLADDGVKAKAVRGFRFLSRR